jgi:hypothetical protein
MQLFFTQLLGKISVISSTKVKEQRGEGGDRRSEARPFCSTSYFLTFFSPRTFFRSRARGSARKKRAWVRIDHPLYQLPTGRWLNFIDVDHEPTPHSGLHVGAPCNLMVVHTFVSPNVRDASTFPPSLEKAHRPTDCRRVTHRTTSKWCVFFAK